MSKAIGRIFGEAAYATKEDMNAILKILIKTLQK